MKLEEFKKGVAIGEQLFQNKDKRDEAIAHFKNMADKCPSNPFFKIRLIKLYMLTRNWSAAESICLLMIRDKIDNFFTHHFHSLILIKKGNKNLALTTIKEAIIKYPEKSGFATQLILLEELEEDLKILKEIRF